MEYIIETKGLTKKYGNRAVVKNLNLRIPKGSVYGFLGPNGAGKTTTMKMLLELAHPTAGSIVMMGKPLTQKNRLAVLSRVGSLIEAPSYYGHLTAKENLKIVCTLKSVPYSEIDSVLDLVRLDGRSKKTVSKFSLGMKQRLGIATALLGKPSLLLLDEPTNGLDPAGMREMRNLIQTLPERFGMTVLVSSHLLSEIDQMADFISIMNHGEILFQDSLSALHERSNPHLRIRTTNNELALHHLPNGNLQGDCILCPRYPDEQMASVSSALSSQQIHLLRVEERETSLEEIFLSITGEGGTIC